MCDLRLEEEEDTEKKEKNERLVMIAADQRQLLAGDPSSRLEPFILNKKMRVFSSSNSLLLPIDDHRLDLETAQQQMQRILADKISNYAAVEELRLLLVSGARADGVVTQGLTPLHYAVHRNHFEAAKLLIVRGAKVDAVDYGGYSAVHLCAERGNLRILKLLLDHLYNRSKCVSFEIKDQPYPIRDGADEPLHLAIIQNHYECAKLLLEMGADPNTRYFDGPQITLVDPKDLSYIRLLLEHGADPNAHSRHGLSPLMKSVELGIVGFKTTQLLVESKADVNSINRRSNYPMSVLHYAVGSGHLQTIEFLLENGAKVNISEEEMRNGSHPSVLHFAIMGGDPEIVELLLRYGADPHSSGAVYGSALHLAACHRIGQPNHSKIVEILLKSGANPNLGVLNSHRVMLRSPVAEFFRRLYKYESEMHNSKTEWIQIVRLFFSYGGEFKITTDNLDIKSMALKEISDPPAYAEQLSQYILRMAQSVEDICDFEESNSIYVSSEQIDYLSKNPRSLQEICRIYIRSLIPIRPEVVESMNLPFFTKDYLLGLSYLPSPL